MPGELLNDGATVQCAHQAGAKPTASAPRVLVDGKPAVTQTAPYVVSGCPFVPPSPGPCVTAQWITAAARVTIDGVPVLLKDSQSICAPTGTPLTVLSTQSRVRGR